MKGGKLSAVVMQRVIGYMCNGRRGIYIYGKDGLEAMVGSNSEEWRVDLLRESVSERSLAIRRIANSRDCLLCCDLAVAIFPTISVDGNDASKARGEERIGDCEAKRPIES